MVYSPLDYFIIVVTQYKGKITTFGSEIFFVSRWWVPLEMVFIRLIVKNKRSEVRAVVLIPGLPEQSPASFPPQTQWSTFSPSRISFLPGKFTSFKWKKKKKAAAGLAPRRGAGAARAPASKLGGGGRGSCSDIKAECDPAITSLSFLCSQHLRKSTHGTGLEKHFSS